MPRVGKKEFGYGKKGKAAAKAYAKKTGQKVKKPQAAAKPSNLGILTRRAGAY